MSVPDLFVGGTMMVFAMVTVILRLHSRGYVQASAWQKGTISVGFLSLAALGALIFLKGTTGYEAPNVRTALYTLWGIGAVVWAVASRRSRSSDKET